MVPGRHADLRASGADLSEDRRVFVVFNPASGRGRGARRLETYRRLLGEKLPEAVFGVTTRPGEERDLAERALADGFDLIVAVGGDGTWGNVADRGVASVGLSKSSARSPHRKRNRRNRPASSSST